MDDVEYVIGKDVNSYTYFFTIVVLYELRRNIFKEARGKNKEDKK